MLGLGDISLLSMLELNEGVDSTFNFFSLISTFLLYSIKLIFFLIDILAYVIVFRFISP